MGFFERQWATPFKGIWITSRRIRRAATKAENYGGAAQKLLFEEFPELIEHWHRVTAWMRMLIKFVKDVKKSGQNCFKVLYNELTQDMAEEREVHEILTELQQFWSRMPNDRELLNTEKIVLITIAKDLKVDEGRERFQYKELLAVMHELANIDKEHEDIMDIIRTFAKRRADMGKPLEKVVWKFEASKVRRQIRDTRQLRKEIKKLMILITESRKSNVAQQRTQLKQLEADLQQAAADISAMYKESFLVKERAFLSFMKLMYIAEQCERYVDKQIRVHNVPGSAEQNLRDEYKKALRELTKDLQVVAQEYRILIHDFERDIREDEALARA